MLGLQATKSNIQNIRPSLSPGRAGLIKHFPSCTRLLIRMAVRGVLSDFSSFSNELFRSRKDCLELALITWYSRWLTADSIRASEHRKNSRVSVGESQQLSQCYLTVTFRFIVPLYLRLVSIEFLSPNDDLPMYIVLSCSLYLLFLIISPSIPHW